jgi:YVTN family beta-propeller protein
VTAFAGRQRRGPLALTGVGLALGLLTVMADACSDDPSGPGGAVATVTVTPIASDLFSLNETLQLTAVARDAIGQPLSEVSFSWRSSNNGIASVGTDRLVRSVSNGQVAITATADSIPGSASVIVQQVVAQIAFAVQPGNGWVDSTLVSDPRVEIQDALGSPVVGVDDNIQVSLGSNPSGGGLQGQTSRAAADGVALFPGLSINSVAAGYTLLAASGALGGESDSFNVTMPSVWVGSFLSDSVTIINTVTNTVVGRVAAGMQPSGVGLTPDGLRVYATSRGSGTASEIETTTRTTGPPIALGGSNNQLLTVSPDGERVYVSDAALDSVFVIATASNTKIAAVPTKPFPAGLDVTPDGSFVYVANLSSDSVTVFETATNQVVANIGVGGGQVDALAFQDGSAVYVTRADGMLMVISPATNTVVDSVPVGAIPQFMGSYPGGRDLFVATTAALVIVDTESNSVSQTIPVPGVPFDVAIAPDGTLAYVSCNGNGTVSVIVLATGLSASIPVGAGAGAIDIMPAPLP